MENFATQFKDHLSSFEEGYNTDFTYEKDGENPTFPIEENQTIEDYNFYPDSGF